MGQKFKMWLIRFMEGRYGTYGIDKYNRFLMIAYLVMTVINLILSIVLGGTLMPLVVLSWAAFILFVFRSMSRRVEARRAENVKFEQISGSVRRFLRRQINRLKEIRTHRYRKCRHCRAVLRLPRKTGTMTVTCPRCRKDFEVKILL